MPCSCEGYPPSPKDLVTSAEEAVKRIRQLEDELGQCRRDKGEIQEELDIFRKAYKLMGNGG